MTRKIREYIPSYKEDTHQWSSIFSWRLICSLVSSFKSDLYSYADLALFISCTLILLFKKYFHNESASAPKHTSGYLHPNTDIHLCASWSGTRSNLNQTLTFLVALEKCKRLRGVMSDFKIKFLERQIFRPFVGSIIFLSKIKNNLHIFP